MRYIGVFAFAYAGIMLALNIIMPLIGVHTGTGVQICTLFAAVYGTTAVFSKDHHRAPDRSERRRLTWGSLLASYVVSFIGAYIMLAVAGHDLLQIISDVNQKLTPILLGVAVIIVTLLYYVLMGLCYAMFGKIAARQFA